MDGESMVEWRNALDAGATRAGLVATVTEREVNGHPMFGVTVERTADDWSMKPTEIAIARTEPQAARKALEALKRMGPQIAAKLDAASPEPPDTRIAAGIGADGIVTALRVERDGTVRLSPEDIEAIAAAVVRRIEHPQAPPDPAAFDLTDPEGVRAFMRASAK